MASSTDPLHFLNLAQPIQIPTKANRITNFPPDIIASDAQSTTIILHSRLPGLFTDFLEHKRQHGSSVEKELYGTNDHKDATFTWKTLATRPIQKRPLAFLGGRDSTLLRDGTNLNDAVNEWDRNGTEEQGRYSKLTLKEYLSYEEIMLSSLIGVSGPSFFINNGERYNSAKPGRKGEYQDRGIIIGLVGARFERNDRMDLVHVLPPVRNPRQHPALSMIFSEFFGGRNPENMSFDVGIYKARMRITVETLLLEANRRASESSQKAFLHVVGLGLGVWQMNASQPQYYIEIFTSCLRSLSLPSVSTMVFSWISVPSTTRSECVAAAKEKDIRVLFNKRNPADPDVGSGELLVVSYAWDGNSFPGNEFWMGSLNASGDPAAACFSTIAELHNSYVNPFAERIEVLEVRTNDLSTS